MTKRIRTILWFLPLAVSLGGSGCDSEGDDGSGDMQDDGLDGADGSTQTDDGGSGDDAGDTGTGGDTDLPELNETAILAWLEAGGYADWTAESAIHPSSGPHGRVKVFFNPALEMSFMDGNESHPANAAAVKELYNADDEPTGWAVAIKAEADSAGGENWFWFQHSGGTTAVAEFGAEQCVTCHSAGVDYIATSYPLN